MYCWFRRELLTRRQYGPTFTPNIYSREGRIFFQTLEQDLHVQLDWPAWMIYRQIGPNHHEKQRLSGFPLLKDINLRILLRSRIRCRKLVVKVSQKHFNESPVVHAIDKLGHLLVFFPK